LLDNVNGLSHGLAGSQDIVNDDDSTLQRCANHASSFAVLRVSL
jgi:hypothetical protein